MHVRDRPGGCLMAEQKLFFEDVGEGDEAPIVSHELTRTDLVMYAGASGDFNPMHHDEVKAQAAGMPSVFGHGMFSMGLLGRAITDWVGIGNLRQFKVRFTKQTWPGEVLTTHVKVAKAYSQRKGISYGAWKEFGVPSDVLKKAGITRGAS